MKITVTCIHCGCEIKGVDANKSETVNGFACPRCGGNVRVVLGNYRSRSKDDNIKLFAGYFLLAFSCIFAFGLALGWW